MHRVEVSGDAAPVNIAGAHAPPTYASCLMCKSPQGINQKLICQAGLENARQKHTFSPLGPAGPYRREERNQSSVMRATFIMAKFNRRPAGWRNGGPRFANAVQFSCATETTQSRPRPGWKVQI